MTKGALVGLGGAAIGGIGSIGSVFSGSASTIAGNVGRVALQGLGRIGTNLAEGFFLDAGSKSVEATANVLQNYGQTGNWNVAGDFASGYWDASVEDYNALRNIVTSGGSAADWEAAIMLLAPGGGSNKNNNSNNSDSSTVNRHSGNTDGGNGDGSSSDSSTNNEADSNNENDTSTNVVASGNPNAPTTKKGEAFEDSKSENNSSDDSGNNNSSGKPEWLQRIEAGNQFNKDRAPFYDYNEVYVRKPDGSGYYRLDSYKPGEEIVSRKHTQLSEVQESTALNYINEIENKYPEGAEIANVPSNIDGANAGIFDHGTTLRGEKIFEVPVQENPIPQSVIDVANEAGVTIRDIDGHIYNPKP